jgi:hypothetical protein
MKTLPFLWDRNGGGVTLFTNPHTTYSVGSNKSSAHCSERTNPMRILLGTAKFYAHYVRNSQILCALLGAAKSYARSARNGEILWAFCSERPNSMGILFEPAKFYAHSVRSGKILCAFCSERPSLKTRATLKKNHLPFFTVPKAITAMS